jgi:8-amino-7-oxononanoate synthase
MHGGARLSGAKIATFAHNDVAAARELLAQQRANHPHCLVLTETIFSMDGDAAPLVELSALAQEFDAWFMTDDAHGLGVVADPAHVADIQMGTLSKGAGSYGGYVCASRAVVDLLINRARSFIYSTGLAPASAAAALAALEVMERDPARCARPFALAQSFTRQLKMPDAQSAIVPVILGDAERALAASRALERDGFLVIAIRPPTVPAGTARLRITFTAEHGDDDVMRLAQAVSRL